jgi:carboxymethylenebutenolidase
MRRVVATAVKVLLAVVGVVVLALVGVILFDTLMPSQRVTDFTNVTFTDTGGATAGGATHHAYLAKPEGAGPHPGVLLIHEFFGLNADIVAKADILAREGYTVLAVDAYGGKTTKQLLRAILFVTTTPQERISRNVDAGYAYLAGLDGVDPGRIGAAGFCFGGTQVMQLGTRNPDLAAAAIFYGSGPIQDPAELGVLGQNGPVLGIFGEQDQSIPVSQVNGFKLAMDARGINNQVTIYPGVGHAFVHADNITAPGAAQDAWRELLDFLAATLKKGQI